MAASLWAKAPGISMKESGGARCSVARATGRSWAMAGVAAPSVTLGLLACSSS